MVLCFHCTATALMPPWHAVASCNVAGLLCCASLITHKQRSDLCSKKTGLRPGVLPDGLCGSCFEASCGRGDSKPFSVAMSCLDGDCYRYILRCSGRVCVALHLVRQSRMGCTQVLVWQVGCHVAAYCAPLSVCVFPFCLGLCLGKAGCFFVLVASTRQGCPICCGWSLAVHLHAPAITLNFMLHV